jgi:hypothetical protein
MVGSFSCLGSETESSTVCGTCSVLRARGTVWMLGGGESHL